MHREFNLSRTPFSCSPRGYPRRRVQRISNTCWSHSHSQFLVRDGLSTSISLLTPHRGILHDEQLYGPNTAQFNPSRFLDKSKSRLNPDMPPGLEGFGFGRRICPGIHIITDELWLAIVSVLSVFDIASPPDLTEKERESLGRYTSGLLVHPVPFRCQFTLRSEPALKAVKDANI